MTVTSTTATDHDTPVPSFAEVTDFAHRAHPAHLWNALRARPVHRDVDGRWIVAGWAEVRQLFADPRMTVFLDLDFDRVDATGCPVSTRPAGAETTHIVREDAPVHDRLRYAFMKHFGPPNTPELVIGLRPRIAQLVRRRLDALREPGRMDVVDDFTYPIPVEMICQVLGLPHEDHEKFGHWMHPVVDTPEANATPEQIREREQAAAEMNAYLVNMIEKRRAEPADDMISAVIHDPQVEAPADRVIADNLFALFIGGHDTTVNSTATTILNLLRHPELMAEVKAAPELIPSLFEEMLRLEPPIQFLSDRKALVDVEIGGSTIPKGSEIVLCIAAANRDPRRFPDPDRIDLHRHDNQHLSFAGGPHYCFGAPMARIEGEIMLREWLRRVRNPRLVTDPPPFRERAMLRGPRHLLVDHDGLDD